MKKLAMTLLGILFLSLAGEVSAADVHANPQGGGNEARASAQAGNPEDNNEAKENSNTKTGEKRYVETYKEDNTPTIRYGGSFRVRAVSRGSR